MTMPRRTRRKTISKLIIWFGILAITLYTVMYATNFSQSVGRFNTESKINLQCVSSICIEEGENTRCIAFDIPRLLRPYTAKNLNYTGNVYDVYYDFIKECK